MKTKRKSQSWAIPLLFVLVAALMTLALPRGKSFMYSYEKGSPWMYETLNAVFDFPIMKTNEELRTEREQINARYIPYFSFKNDVEADQLRRFTGNALASDLDSVQRKAFVKAFTTVYHRGILNEDRFRDLNPDVPVAVVQDKQLREAMPAELFTPRLAYEYVYAQMLPLLESQDAIYVLFERLNIADLLVPNLVFDDKTTKAVLEQKLQSISPTKGVVYNGQRIISKGEVVTAGTEQILDSMKAEYNASVEYNGQPLWLFLGRFLYMLLSLGLLYVVLWIQKNNILYHYRELLFILLLMVIVTVGTAFVVDWSKRLLYLLPIPVLVLYMDAFFRSRVALAVYWVMLLPLVLVTRDFGGFVISNLVAGTCLLYTFHYWNRGWQQFLSSIATFLAYVAVSLAEYLISNGSLAHYDWLSLRFVFLAAVMCVICYPLVFIFEKIFGFVSIARLRDLTDTNTKLLRLLSEAAPGTMQHSLQVANLADNAARAIGANHLLCRVGALYHDIGKINAPQNFIENQPAGMNPHEMEKLTPEESARRIIVHVEDGMTLARRYGLPSLVSDFILSHHGTSRTGYFYSQYVNAGGDPANDEDFRYHGRLPQSREEVIVSLADAIEAASRSAKDYSMESVGKLVDGIVHARVVDDQLGESAISLRDLHTVKEAFKTHLREIYHGRIAYPAINRH